jgi:hypothetical protein
MGTLEKFPTPSKALARARSDERKKHKNNEQMNKTNTF